MVAFISSIVYNANKSYRLDFNFVKVNNMIL